MKNLLLWTEQLKLQAMNHLNLAIEGILWYRLKKLNTYNI